MLTGRPRGHDLSLGDRGQGGFPCLVADGASCAVVKFFSTVGSIALIVLTITVATYVGIATSTEAVAALLTVILVVWGDLTAQGFKAVIFYAMRAMGYLGLFSIIVVRRNSSIENPRDVIEDHRDMPAVAPLRSHRQPTRRLGLRFLEVLYLP